MKSPILLSNIHSLSDFQRNTKEHLRNLKESGEVEVLTVNGKAELVVQSAEGYQILLDRLELQESALICQQAIIDHKEGRSISIEEFRAKRIYRSHAVSRLNEEA